MSKKIVVVLNEKKEEALKEMMDDDLETNVSGYVGNLIVQEHKRRTANSEPGKRPVGRPKKEKDEEDTNLYPAPYKGGGAYTAVDWKAWYEFRGVTAPPLPEPLTPEEIEKFN